MERRPKNSFRTLFASLGIAWCINFAVNSGLAIYHEHLAFSNPSYTEYSDKTTKIKDDRLSALRELYLVEKAEKCLDTVYLFLENHSLNDKLEETKKVDIEVPIEDEKERLNSKIKVLDNNLGNLEAELNKNPIFSKHHNLSITYTGRIFYPLYKLF